MKPLINHLIVLGLAAAALLFATGCSFDLWAFAVGYDPEQTDETYYALRCDPSTKTFSIIEVPYGTQDSVPSEGYFVSSLGKPCVPSTEGKGRPNTISEPVNSPAASPSTTGSDPNSTALPKVLPLTTTTPPPVAPPALINTFPWLEPLAFSPAFPVSDAGKNPLTCAPTLEAFLVNHDSATVSAIGLCPFRVIREIPVRSNPLQLAITPDGSTAVVTSYDGAVTFIDVATNTVKGTLDLPNYNPSGIAISPDSTRAYVTHYLDVSPALLVIDIPNRKLLSAIALPKQYPRVVTLTPDGSQAWVNYFSDRVISIVDVLTGTVASTVDLGNETDTGLVFDPTGSKAYVAVYPDQIVVVDTATLSTVAKVTVGISPMDLQVSAEGTILFVTTESDPNIWWVDLATNKVVKRTVLPAGTAGGSSMGLAVFH